MTRTTGEHDSVTNTEVWNGFETMTATECRRMLETTDIGRLALSAGALPVVLPVQYWVDHDRLLLRTPGHHELGSDLDGQIVGFEADFLDAGRGEAWCVLVTGPVRSLPSLGVAHPLHRWFADGSLLELRTDIISGHRAAV